MDWNDKLKELQKPFNYSDIQWRLGYTDKEKLMGTAMAYVSNRAIQNRLDQVFGLNGWRNEFQKWGDKAQLCGISIWDEDKKEWITKWDGADNTHIEPTKGGLSDSMKRAAYQWGIGRYLYDLPSVWTAVKVKGKGFAIVKNPELPSWALDEGDLDLMKIGILEKKTALKGLTEDKICSKYFRETFAELNVNQFKEISKLLDKYQDVKDGEEPIYKK